MYTELFDSTPFSEASERVLSKTKYDVEAALDKSSNGRPITFEEYLALISPSADSYLEEMAALSQHWTRKRFGNIVSLYMPMYLSNECRSSCIYCGFSYENKIPRKTLSEEEIHREAQILHAKGIRHLVFLTGEEYSKTNLEYLKNAVKILRQYFDSISIEIYPMDVIQYSQLIAEGVEGLVVYQETYDPDVYVKYHLRGIKKNMHYRLEAPDRGGIAGFRRIGLGTLLGLANPYGEMFKLGEHASYISKSYWRSTVQISLPRMRPAAGDFNRTIKINDREFVRFLFALRLFLPDSGIVQSTRETRRMRDHLAGLVVTHMSVESRTDPGGYSGGEALKQFEIEDERRIPEILEMLRSKGLDPVFKDFDLAFLR
ncbi:thiazole biosynthesis protein ThiH [Leptospira fainei serovar Hurstbridge str. BUT 6]|uniref:Thiazole biosynthesis protein ThiH n=1 Tax=Leptospira fainei serovar Hurstbridge str. BUT 6 TaxID=1193011 RepID=S3V2J4_9LEPT|nr:2-iminoacetate synthase ThiH [Leptospira fainei]EPG74859.1 thiazole biosynthesis protein ThiH [Leptospira fainei serovar Hurstbridge str. BUT 6]